MEIEKKCDICGTTFIAKANHWRYCCAACRRVAERHRDYSVYRNRIARERMKEISKKEAVRRIAKEAKEAGMSYGQYVAWKEYGMKREAMR